MVEAVEFNYKMNAFLVPNDNKNFQIESLQSLGINKEKVLSS